MQHRLLTLTLAALLAVPSAAFAASATQDGYGPDDGLIEVTPTPAADDIAPDTVTPTPAPAATGSLPFTGLEAGLIGVAGLALAGTGLALRRTAREQ